MTELPERCPFCGSKAIFKARHDCDWGGGNSFSPLSKDKSVYTPLNLCGQKPDDFDCDIETNYCADCCKFGDFKAIEKLIFLSNREPK